MFGRVRGELEAVAAGFDPALIDARTASEELDEVIAIENIAAGMRARLAARVAETGIWRETGERSAAEALARRTGVTVRDAKATIATGRKLRELPATAEAAARGELSSSQTAAIADAASADAHAEGPLLEQAQRGSLQELRDECARTKAKVIDLEERRRQIHAERSVRDWVDGEGVGKLLMEDNPEVIAAVASRLRTEGERRMEAVPRDEREPLVAYLADALHDLVCTAPATDENLQSRRTHPDVKMLVRVDLPVLLRGYPMGRDAGDEVCEIVGYGPVATSVIHDLLDTADPFLAAIATDGDQVLGVAHLGRRANAKQQSALEWLYPTCTVEGCTRSTYLENDHREDWATTHLTVLDWLDRPCAHHHRLKTHHGWALVEGHGKRPMVPPDDPRHPRHAGIRKRANSPPTAA